VLASSSCRTRIVGPLFDQRVSPYYCVEPAAYAALPASGTLRAELRETWFGQYLVRVSLADPALHH
jgi:hypothetical protein